MAELLLNGLDGTNPLAFFAALGTLSALHEIGPGDCRLSWREVDTWRPVIHTASLFKPSELIDALVADQATWATDPCRFLRYATQGGKKSGGKEAFDLKPPPAVFRAYLEGLLAKSGRDRRRSIDFAAAFATDVAVDNNGNAKPTAFHFTAGQQEFLAMVDVLATKVEPADLEEAVLGPWVYAGRLPVLGWDVISNRDYALRASNPSTDKKFGVPGADWLAFRGLSYFPVMSLAGRLTTTGCSGDWKHSVFCWPLWSVPLSSRGVRSVLKLADLESMSWLNRDARGIGAVLKSSISRSDQGGYGSFSPPRVC